MIAGIIIGILLILAGTLYIYTSDYDYEEEERIRRILDDIYGKNEGNEGSRQ